MIECHQSKFTTIVSTDWFIATLFLAIVLLKLFINLHKNKF